jgi:hypothetical protein
LRKVYTFAKEALPLLQKPSQVKLTSLFASAAGMGVAAILLASAPRAQLAAVAATPPPTPPPIGTPATPQPNASLAPAPATTPSYGPMLTNSAATPKPTPSPPPNVRRGLEGVWEVQIQHSNTTDYTHFAIRQQGDALTGTYLDARGKKYPIAGSVDGQAIRLIVSMPNGTTLLLEGKLDGTTDMIGMLTMPDGTIPFTAAYRPKEKWIDNVNASPGGMGGGGMGGGGTGGGYTPP